MRKQALDKTDIAIIGHLQVDGRRAFTAIAKDLGYAPLPSGLKDATLKLIDAIGS